MKIIGYYNRGKHTIHRHSIIKDKQIDPKKLSKKPFFLISLILGLVLFLGIAIPSSFGMQHYQTVDFSTGLVTASSLNVRQRTRNYI